MREYLGVSTGLSATPRPTLDERIETVVVEKLSAFAANQKDLLNRLQERLPQTESRLEKMLTTGEVQISSVSVHTVGKAVDIAEVV
jgi:hypothetical protein